MHVSRRELLKGAAALGAAGVLPSALPDAQTTRKKEFVTAQGGDIGKLDPHFRTSSNEIRVSFNPFDNLTSRHPDGKLSLCPRVQLDAYELGAGERAIAGDGRTAPAVVGLQENSRGALGRPC